MTATPDQHGSNSCSHTPN